MRYRSELFALIPLLLFALACEPPPADEALAPEDRAALETDGDCGHQAFLPECDGEEIASAIRDFLR